MKSYFQQKYPVSVKVEVWFDHSGEDTMIDEIKGLNAGHAFYLARLNWPDAKKIKRVQP